MLLEIQLEKNIGDRLLPYIHSIAPGSFASFSGRTVSLDCGNVGDPAQVRIELNAIPHVTRVDWVE